MSHNPVGLTGLVTGTVRPGGVGEVQLPFGGGTNTFLAYPHDGQSTIPIGRTVTVVAVASTGSVYVRETHQDPGTRYEPSR